MKKTAKRFTGWMVILAMLITLLPTGMITVSAYSGSGGDGTSESPYLISTADDLRELAAAVNGGESFSGEYFEVTQDIDLEGSEQNQWTPIGGYGANTSLQFLGTFDGGGYEISGLYINNRSALYQGLFGYLGEGGTIQNLGVSGSVAGYFHVGGVVGENHGTVSGCYNTGDVNGSYSNVGGVVGRNYGIVSDAYNTGEVSGGNVHVGGVAGYNAGYGDVIDSYNTGGVTGGGDVGGVVGFNNNGSVTACYYLAGSAATSDGGSALTAVQFADQNSFSGWDFRTVWTMDALLGRPVLIGAREPGGWHGGSGTQDDPYIIPDLETLERFRDSVNSGNTYEGQYIKIELEEGVTAIDMSSKYGAEIDGAEVSWEPIGNQYNRFLGNFDGGGYEISGLYINAPDTAIEIGLFGFLAPGGAIQNLGVSGSVSGGGAYVGGVVGDNNGTVSGCYNAAEISITDGEVGGVVGVNGGTVSDCYNAAAISIDSGEVGGVVGMNARVVINSYNTGSVTGNSANVGSVVGYNIGNGTVTNCYYNSDIYTAEDTTTGVTGIGAAEFADEEKFTGAGWDFENTWIMSALLERPVLRNNAEGGTGTQEAPYIIPDLETLERFRDSVNNGNTYEGQYVKIELAEGATAIDMSHKYGAAAGEGETEVSWTPIGNFENQFLGNFDGGGYMISGLYVNNGSADDQGLFGYLGEGGAIQNLGVSGSVAGDSYVGGIVGNNFGTVSDSYNAGKVDGYYFVGGIVGNNFGTVANCYNTGAVTGSNNYVGGAVGYNQRGAEVSGSYNTGDVNGGDNYVGGVVGSNDGTVSDSYNTGSVTGSNINVGGAVGLNRGTVTNSYYNSDVYTAEDTTTGVTGKTTAQFASGEAAYLLQSGQTAGDDGVIPQVWGQTIGVDQYPALTSDVTRSILKVSFMIAGETEGSYTEYAAAYANPNGTVTLPQDPAATNDSAFAYWTTSADTAADPPSDRQENAFNAETSLTEDTTVYAVYARRFVSTDASATIYAGVGGSKTIDLCDYIEFADASLDEDGQFTFTADGELPGGATMQGTQITWTPTAEAEPISVTFTVTDNAPYVSLAELDPDPAAETAKLTLSFAVAPDISEEFEPDESDTSKTTYLISAKEDMEALAEYVNSRNTGEGLTFKMTNDIDLEGSEENQWTPIGNNRGITGGPQFHGTFDGGGYEISGLYINSPDSSFQGLFGCVGEGGEVRGLGVSGSVMCRGDAGGVVAWNRVGAAVIDCYNTGLVTGAGSYVGGVVGANDGEIIGCYNAGAVTAGDDGAGGVAGSSSGTVRNSCNTGEIKGNRFVGGVVGRDSDHYDGAIGGCYNTGTVSGSSYVGGVVGENRAIASDCYNTGTVSGSSYVGGVAGSNSVKGEVIECYNIGSIEGEQDVGGVVGSNDGTVSGCYYNNEVYTAEDTTVGVTGIGAAEFADEEKFTGAGWDFENTWIMSALLERPVLRNNAEGGTGTQEAPYIIPDLETLERFRDSVNNGNTYEGQYVKIELAEGATAIDMSHKYGAAAGEGETEVSWTPIGNFENQFLGNFDGGGYMISGLYVNNGSADDQGLFGYIGEGGTIQNLGVSGSVAGPNNVGGIAGYSNGVVTNSYNTGSVSGSNNFVGGLVGWNEGVVTNSYNTGSVTGSNNFVGGVVGYNNEGAEVSDSYNTGVVNGGGNVGGVTGTNYGTVRGSYNTGSVTGSNNYVGGVVGYNNEGAGVSECYNTGSVESIGRDYVGGVAGSNDSTINDSYNIGDVTGNSYVGGVSGDNFGTVSGSYNTGKVDGYDDVGGVVGVNNSSVTNSYYLEGVAADNGFGEMKTAAQFASGEVAYLLQDAQEEVEGVKPQVWGQTLSGETPDQYPALTDDNARLVLKASFMIVGETEGSYTEYAAAYANPNGTVTLPAAPTFDEYEFKRWSQTQSIDGAEFTDQTAVTADITVYAVGEEMYGSTEDEKKIETTYGVRATQDLSEYMTYAAGTDASGRFAYEITGGNNTTATANGNTVNTTISGDTLTIPADTNADTYTLTIKATAINPEISLASVDYGAEPVSFDVSVVVNKAESTVSVAPTANTPTYTGEELALVTAGEAVGGTMVYRLGDDGEYTENIPQATDADTYTVWYMVRGDNNHNDTGPQSVSVTIGKSGSETEVSGASVTYGDTLTLTAEVSRSQTEGAALAAEQDTVEFFVGNTSLGTATVEYNDTTTNDQGAATLEIDTAEKDLVIGDNTVRAEYGGSVNLNGSESDTITVNMQAKPIEYSAAAKDKTYDGSAAVNVTLTPTNLEEDDNVTLTASGAVSSADAGEYSSVNLTNITLGGNDMEYYSADAAATATLTEAVTIEQARESQPYIGIDYINETLTGFEDGASYTVNGSDITVENVSAAIDNSWFGQTVSIVKKASDSNHSDSEAQNLEIPARPSAPAAEDFTVTQPDAIGGTGSISGVTDDMEYSIDGGETWTRGDGYDITEIPGGTTYSVRYAAIEGAFRSDACTITIIIFDGTQEPAPSIEIDYINETLTGFEDGGSYLINGEAVNPTEGVLDISGYIGTTISIVKMGDGVYTYDSESQTLEIPARPTAPAAEDFTVTQPDAIGGTGSISGLTDDMEYSIDGGETWTRGDGYDITEIPGGTTYSVRYAAIEGAFRSDACTITIIIFDGTQEPAPSIEIDYINETLTGFEDGGSYLINGEAVNPTEGVLDISGYIGTTISIVKMGDGIYTYDSEPQNLEIPARQAAPEGVSGGTRRITGVDETMEYKLSSAEEWTAIEGTTLTDLSAGTYQVRIAATEDDFASEPVSVTVSSGGGGGGSAGGWSGGSYTPAATPTASAEPSATEEPGATAEPGATSKPSSESVPEATPSVGDISGAEDVFTDVPEDAWYNSAVEYVYENGLMNGTSETEFSPDTNITRGMFVTVLYRMEGSPETALDYGFADVPQDEYYAEAVAWADDYGIVLGYSETEFAPEQTISREQMAAIIYRYAGYKGEDTTVQSGAAYTDSESISDYALDAVAWATENGIMQGRTDGTFAPADFTTRAEAAAVFERTNKLLTEE